MALISDEHICQLALQSYSNLPIMPPYSGWRQTFWHNFQKYLMLPSMRHPLSGLFFRSSSALAFERKRYIRYNKWYIIHPLSNMIILRQIIQFVVWTIAWIYFPYFKTFIRHAGRRNLILYSTYIIIVILCYLIILSYFFTGYHNVDTKEIVFDQKKIILRYLKTYFIIDFVVVFPVNLFVNFHDGFMMNEMVMMTQVFLKLIRLPEYFVCFRQITHRHGMTEMLHDKLCLPVTSLIIIHWCSCSIYIAYLRTKQENTWFMLNIGKEVINHNQSFGFDAYRIVVGKMICIFLRAGVGLPEDQGSRQSFEQLILSVIMIAAFIMHVFTIIVVLQLSRSENASEYKYEEIVSQLKQFMRSRDLPFDLQFRILQYYEHRYQNHYFKEESIQTAISDHLYHEIFLNGCARLIETTNILQGLSRYIIGEIIICLTPDVFLINDFVTRVDDPADYLYFISYGTAAMFSPDGEEIIHLEDGDLVGLMQNETCYLMDVIAIEITEVFRWNKRDYLQCLRRHETLAQKIDVMRKQREEYIKDYRYKKESDRYTGNVLYQLGRGRIVDKLTKRANILDSAQQR